MAEAVKKIVLEKCRDARVIVFGSVVEDKTTAMSDIDILVICDLDVGERARLKIEIRRKLGYDVPVELHVASEDEFHRWYKRFMGAFEEV